ncbi:MAG: glycosyltransferase [Bacteroidetes bacterium]|nr:glycosyltransferase [Bacteroidota bacterium]
MIMNQKRTIGFPHKAGTGGPGSFQTRFESELRLLGWQIIYPNDKVNPEIVFIIGGTKKLFWLSKLKIKGIPIIYRLDGRNWLHWKKKKGISNILLLESRNIISTIIYAFFADIVIFQSKFVENWWKKIKIKSRVPYTVIYNGVNLNIFKPFPSISEKVKLLIVEGAIDYSPYSLELLNQLMLTLSGTIEIFMYGNFENELSKEKLNPEIKYMGVVSREKLPLIYQNAIYLSLDVNPACPNTVIEALACGAPVVGFDTGSLKELVPPNAGFIVPYGSDPWELGFPDVKSLVDAILNVKNNWQSFSLSARQVAEDRFDIHKIINSYLNTIEKNTSKN